MSDQLRPRASLRTAVVWDVLKDALDRQVKATGRDALDVLGHRWRHRQLRGAGRPARPQGHRRRPQPPTRSSRWSAAPPRPGSPTVSEASRGDILGLFEVVDRGGYDAVLCHGVLEYVDDPAEGGTERGRRTPPVR
ncbi:hypothetical protein GCM10018966_063680 [Streptomyces yanii]